MRKRCPAWIPMLGVLGFIWAALSVPANAAPVFFSGSPCFLFEPTPCPDPRFGTIINFDDLATNIPLPPAQYAAQGLVSITNTGLPLLVVPGSQSFPNAVGTGADDNWVMNAIFRLAGPTDRIGIGIADSSDPGNPSINFIDAYDVHGNVIATHAQAPDVIIGGTTFPNNYSGFADSSYEIAALGVRCLVTTPGLGAAACQVDDLQFDPPVPEPSSLLLLGAGLPLALVWRRGRRASKADRSEE